MPNKLLELLKSRKFWAAIVGLAFVLLKNFWPNFPLAENQIADVVYLVVAFILGTALEDAGRAAQSK
jgi:hypothetical protein